MIGYKPIFFSLKYWMFNCDSVALSSKYVCFNSIKIKVLNCVKQLADTFTAFKFTSLKCSLRHNIAQMHSKLKTTA